MHTFPSLMSDIRVIADFSDLNFTIMSAIRKGGGGRKKSHPAWKLKFFEYNEVTEQSKCLCKVKRTTNIHGIEETQETECVNVIMYMLVNKIYSLIQN
jgi:hypothetical protein